MEPTYKALMALSALKQLRQEKSLKKASFAGERDQLEHNYFLCVKTWVKDLSNHRFSFVDDYVK
jgi:hypothetical protein